MDCLICHKVDPSNPKFHLSTWTPVICRLLEIPETNLDKIFKKNSTTSTNSMWICIDCNGRLIEGHRLLDLLREIGVKLSKIKNDIFTLLEQSPRSTTDQYQDNFDDQSSPEPGTPTKLEDGHFTAITVYSSSTDDPDEPEDEDFNLANYSDGPAGPEPERDQQRTRIRKLKSRKSRKNVKNGSQIVKTKAKKARTSLRKSVNKAGPKSFKAAMLKDHHQSPIKSKSKPKLPKLIKLKPKKVKKVKKVLACAQCNITFTTKGNLNTHNKEKHSKAEDVQSFICDHCGKIFLQERYLKFHLRSHGIGEGAIQCGFCSKFLKSQRLYDRHVAYAHGEGDNKTLLCELCPAKFSTKQGYEDHKMIEHLGLGQKYTCDRCGKTFASQTAVAGHIKRVHEKDYRFFCPEPPCQKPFLTLVEMKNHFEVIHQGIKKFACTEPNCEKRFTKNSRLLLHIKSAHTEEKPFKCTTCFKDFSSVEGFKRHNLLHSGIRNHTCTICGESYTLKSSLNLHIAERHEGKKALHPDMNKRKKFVRRSRVSIVEPNGQDNPEQLQIN